MAKNKTTETEFSVLEYVNKITDEKRKKDFFQLVEIFKNETGLEPKMWGTAIVGYGSYHYIYESGREGDAPLTGLSSRANAIVLYLGSSFDQREELLEKFGKYKSGKGCIYVQKLEDVDSKVLGKMIKNSVARMKKLYPGS